MPIRFTGSTLAQDSRFKKRNQSSASSRIPPGCKTPIDMKNVDKKWFSKWIEAQVKTILGHSDPIASSTIAATFSGRLNAGKIMETANMFLGKKAPDFVQLAWAKLAKAQKSPSGMPVSDVKAAADRMRAVVATRKAIQSSSRQATAAPATAPDRQSKEETREGDWRPYTTEPRRATPPRPVTPPCRSPPTPVWEG